MDSSSENTPPDLHKEIRELASVCTRIADTLDKMERIYAGEVLASERLRQQNEEDRKKYEERQQKWDDDQQKEREKKAHELAEARKEFFYAIGANTWQGKLLWVWLGLTALAILQMLLRY